MISILNKYLIKQFFKSFLAILFFITFVIYAAESIELFRRIGSYDSVSFFDVFYLSFLKTPKTVQILLPFIFLFAGMGAFSNLTKNKELMVMRAAGMSAFKIIMPIAIFSLILGFIYIFFFNPIFANMTHKFKIEKASLLGLKEDIFDISGKGIWIRDGGDEDSYFIYAASMNKEGRQFENVTFYRYRDQKYMDRIDSDMAILNPGDWVLQQPIITPFDAPSYQEDVLHLVSTIQFEKIPDYLIDPEELSFWQLSDYIEQLRQRIQHLKSTMLWLRRCK